jgi:glycosyltransferase involved in cell wall biosynthesis
VWRRALRFIARAVNSIYRQTYRNISIIFVKYAEIDGFAAFIEKMKSTGRFKSIRVVDVEGSTVRSRTLWAGLKAVRTPFFANLDDDDEWFSEHISDLMDVFKSTPHADIVHCGGIKNNEEGRSPDLHPRLKRADGSYVNEPKTLEYMSPNDTGKLFQWHNTILSHSFVAKTSLLDEVLLSDPN